MKFTDKLWKDIDSIYQNILKHPFINELTEGSLPEETFIYYMKQDALYLNDFTRALAMAGLRSREVGQMKSFLEFALGAVSVERALHENYFKKYEVTLDVDKSPSCFMYTHYLLSVAAYKNNSESIAALLPCFWIYREVGMHIYNKSNQNNPYADWIDTYAGEEFDESVNRAIEITDVVAEQTPETEKRRMRKAFINSSKLEWLFWDSAYRREQWPVG